MFSSNAALLLLEAVIYSSIVALCLLFPSFPVRIGGFCQPFTNFWSRVAQRRVLSIVLSIVFVLAIRGVLMTVLPTPVPGVHDEFSYLLAGDTFASGRLTNPTHPCWKSLETFYVIQQPTYSSMYPPAQGLALAAGEVLTHRPWIGVYLSAAFMAGAICWMLQGYVPAQWALLGGLLTASRLGIYSYWTESYWGGAVAAIGGALVIGSLPRILKKRTATSAIMLAIGALILANSRPFEGLLVVAPICCITLIYLLRGKLGTVPVFTRKVFAPFCLVLTLGLLSMGTYFWRVTGSPFQMPYALHSSLYEVTGPFIWQPLRKAPEYRYVEMEKYHVGRQTAAFTQAHSLTGWTTETVRKAESLLFFYFWPAIIPTLIALLFLRNNATVRLAVLLIAIMFLGLCLEIWPMTQHYHAPITAAMMLVLVQTIRFWRQVEWRGRQVGKVIAATIPVFCFGVLALRIGAAVLHISVPEHGLVPWFTVVPGNLYRAEISQFLQRQPGSQLALVRYSADHHVDEEWVHNAADIDHSKVVWARYGEPAQNAQILQYFNGRRVWLVDVGAKAGVATPYQTPVSTQDISSATPLKSGGNN